MFSIAFVKLDITIVALLAGLAGRYGRADAAVGLMHMRAASEVALAEKWPELAVAPVQLFARELPQPQLSDAGRVGDIAALCAGQRVQFGNCGGVAALAQQLAHLTRRDAQ